MLIAINLLSNLFAERVIAMTNMCFRVFENWYPSRWKILKTRTRLVLERTHKNTLSI